MAINILNIKPNKVSYDLTGYCFFFYGDVKTGKTTTATQFPKPLLLATERGYKALDGVYPQNIDNWGDLRTVVRQLRSPEAHEAYQNIIIDTIDIAYGYCQKYISAKKDVETVDEISYGKGFGLVDKEFEELLNSILKLGYGLILISHAKDKVFKNEDGTEFNKIIPSLDKRGSAICEGLADVIGYARSVSQETSSLFLRGTPRFVAGSRFKYTPDYITNFNYDELAKVIKESIDKQKETSNKDNFTTERNEVAYAENKEKSYEDVNKSITDKITQLIESHSEIEFAQKIKPKITEITEKYLGKNELIANAKADKIEMLRLIDQELSEL